MALVLPKPELKSTYAKSIPILTDDALASSVGVRIAFTGREGGVSAGPYASLNLASHVEDSLEDVVANRRILVESLGADPEKCIFPNQVHGDTLLTISSADDATLAHVQKDADVGADGLLVEAPDVAALLCFADCASVIIVSPTGRFAVAHAGWRGAIAGIAGKAVRALATLDAKAGMHGSVGLMNVYIGPHIHVECFEVGPEVCERFSSTYGDACVSQGHVSLAVALTCDVERAGIDSSRVIVAPYCTQCNSDRYFSYRGSGGICGRHGAIAFRHI